MNKTVKKLDAVISKVNEWALIIVIAVMFALVFSNVIGRYFFSKTYIWVDELSRYLMISIAFLGMGVAMRGGRHSAFFIIQDIVPPRIRKIMRTFCAAVTMGLILLLGSLGVWYAKMSMNNLTEALRWPVGIWYCVIPIGCALFIWHFAMIITEYINAKPGYEIDAEIAQGEELVGDSEFLKISEVKEVDD